jgi:hypothetical protein
MENNFNIELRNNNAESLTILENELNTILKNFEDYKASGKPLEGYDLKEYHQFNSKINNLIQLTHPAKEEIYPKLLEMKEKLDRTFVKAKETPETIKQELDI